MAETKTPSVEDRLASLEAENEELRAQLGGKPSSSGGRMMVCIETATGGPRDDFWVVQAGERRAADDPLLQDPAVAQFFIPEGSKSPEQIRAELAAKHVAAVSEGRAEARRREKAEQEEAKREAEEKQKRGEAWNQKWQERWAVGEPAPIDFARRSS